MAFSLFKKKKKKAESVEDDDNPFAPEVEEIPASVAKENGSGGDRTKKKAAKKTGFLGRLFGGGKAGRKGKNAKDAKPAADPFDNPALMAQIAQEVAPLPPPETVGEDEPAPAPPEEDVDGARHARPALDLGPEDDGAAAAGLDDMPPGLGDDGFDTFEDEDTGAKGKSRRPLVIGAIAASAVLVLAGAGWFLLSGGSGDGAGEMTVADGAGGTPVASGERISMALPPPPPAPSAEGGALSPPGSLGSEKSLSRRPWLTQADTGKVEGGLPAGDGPPEPAADAQAETKTAETPASETPPGAVAEAPSTDQPPSADAVAQVEPPPAPEATAEQQPRKLRDLKPEQMAMLPPLEEPDMPPAPATEHRMPSYAALPAPKEPAPGLGPAPIDALARRTPQGVLPVKAADGRAPWTAYARPFQAPDAKPRIALVVTGLGLEPQGTEAAITKLPPAVTLSFSPYAPNLADQVAKARAAGHEVLLDLPMEPESFPARDPGPLGLLTMLPQSENLTRLGAIMGKAAGYTGLIGQMGGVYAASRVHLRSVLEELDQRGLLFIQTADPKALAENADLATPAAAATVAVDGRLFRESIDARLKYLEDVAMEHGAAIGVLGPTPLGFERLVKWAEGLTPQRPVLAPASAAIDKARHMPILRTASRS